MYQLMVLDKHGNIIGACTDSNRLPDVKEVFPHESYIGVETSYNMDLIFNYSSYHYRDGEFIKKEPVPYQVTRLYIGPDEDTTIFVPKGTIAAIGGVEYEIDDGIIEYSNPNVGVHQILLMKSGHANTSVYVEVMEE